jgi:cellulose synthase/poly-beta-1,6-N-acetylglucosamine synthase-like glycosyltransferase
MVDLQSLLPALQTALVPVVLSSAGGLLCLVVQTRYGRIVDHTRQLLNLPAPGVEIETVLEMLFKRARYAKWALFGLFVGVSCFLTLSLVILVSMIFPTPVQVALVVGIFSVGWCSMVLGLWFEVLELWDSFRGITLEYAIFKKRIGEQSKL